MPTLRLQSARIVAGSLALLSREIKEVGPPVDLWSPALSPSFISGIAAQVGRGEALPLWVEEHHPARGLAIYTRSQWESDFFGFDAARLMGPFMVVEDQTDRESRAHKLAGDAIVKAQQDNTGLICIKTFHDPAVLRGIISAGFVLAEIGSGFKGEIKGSQCEVNLPGGFDIIDQHDIQSNDLLDSVINDLGDFFYDGHYRHDPLPGPDLARRMWARTAKDDLSGAASLALVIWDRNKKRAAAMASVRTKGHDAFLSILAVTKRYQQKGLGRALMCETLNRLAGQAKTLFIETASYNIPALNLYQSFGFAHTPPLAALHYHNIKAQKSAKK